MGAVFKPTDEQVGIRDDRSDRLLVKAFAGTGKTSSLELKARATPVKSLYVAFNKAIQREAEHRFPGHVTSRTMHSLAFARFGRNYNVVPGKLRPDIKPFHIKSLLGNSLRHLPETMHMLYLTRLIDGVKRFLTSADYEIDPYRHYEFEVGAGRSRQVDAISVLKDMRTIWSAMKDPGQTMIPMIHDGYLKEFQLSEPKLPFDCIYFDEVQDTNPVTQAIIDLQAHAQRVYVGDEHQAIYSFRGANNAIASLDVDSTHYLTASFRFGSQVADVANEILSLKGEVKELRGLGPDSTISCDAADGYEMAYISRGNSALFSRAVSALSLNQPFGFLGDIKGYRLDLIQEVHNLRTDNKVSDPYINSFGSYNAMCEYAEETDDKELKSRAKIVGDYGERIPSLLASIEAKALPVSGEGLRNDILVLTTGHKSKGTEFNRVQLANDFKSFFVSEQDKKPGQPAGGLIDMSQLAPAEIEEFNIQYVASTRAKKGLHLSEQLIDYLEYADELKSAQRCSV